MNRSWIEPLGIRTKQTSYIPENVILKVISILAPVFVYFFLNQAITLILAYIIGTGQYDSKIVTLFDNNSQLIAAIVRSLAVILATIPLIFNFRMEYPVVWDRRRLEGMPLVVILAASSALLLNGLAIFTGFSSSSQTFSQTSSNQFSLPIWLGIIVYGIVTPITEEIVYRGIVYNRARNYFSPIISMICSSFLFGLSHGNIVQLIYGFVMGMLICYVYERFGAFAYPVIFHCSSNIVVYVLLSLATTRNIVISVRGMIVEVLIFAGVMIYILSLKNIDTK